MADIKAMTKKQRWAGAVSAVALAAGAAVAAVAENTAMTVFLLGSLALTLILDAIDTRAADIEEAIYRATPRDIEIYMPEKGEG